MDREERDHTHILHQSANRDDRLAVGDGGNERRRLRNPVSANRVCGFTKQYMRAAFLDDFRLSPLSAAFRIRPGEDEVCPVSGDQGSRLEYGK